MLRSDLCNYSDAYIVFKGDITLTDVTLIDVKNRLVALNSNVLFTDCTLKINGVLIDSAENLGVVMPMYNLLE